MAFEYKDEIKNILLSMSLSEIFPAGAWVGYGFEMAYSASSQASASINLTCVSSSAGLIGSSSLNINGITFSYIGTPIPNTSDTIYIPITTFSDTTLDDFAVTSSNIFNVSKSVAPYSASLQNITSSPGSLGIELISTTTIGTLGNNFSYVSCSISGSTTGSFGGGANMTGSVPGAVTMWDENILSTGTASLQIYIPSSSYLDSPSRTSASLSSLVTTYTNYIWSGSNTISTQIIYAPGEINPYACSATCYQGENPWVWNNVLNSTTIQNPVNRQTTRPIKGGISITSTSQTPPYGPGGRGTMGLVCQDSASGALVGLTNNHVVVKNPFYTNQQSFNLAIQNEYDLVDSSNTVQGDFVYQTGESQPVNPGGPLEIGRVLRYVPLYTSASTAANPIKINNSDAAIFSLYCTASGGATIIDFTSSFQQVGLAYTSSMPFASTAEINNLMNTNPELYSSGRTTGAKGSPGTLCPLRIWSFVNSNVNYNLQGTSTPAYMQDLIAFVKPDNSASYAPSGSGAPAAVCPYPAWAGDSGSTLIANIGGVWKIVGLVFAGNGMPYNPPVTGLNYEIASSMGLACRIDYVASQLGIKAWTGSAAPIVDPNNITYVTVSGSNDTKILNCSGSDYYQVGLTEKHNFC